MYKRQLHNIAISCPITIILFDSHNKVYLILYSYSTTGVLCVHFLFSSSLTANYRYNTFYITSLSRFFVFILYCFSGLFLYFYCISFITCDATKHVPSYFSPHSLNLPNNLFFAFSLSQFCIKVYHNELFYTSYFLTLISLQKSL